MSALGYACVSLVGAIWLIGLILEETYAGAFATMTVVAIFPGTVAFIDGLDHILDRTVDRWLAKHWANKNFEEEDV